MAPSTDTAAVFEFWRELLSNPRARLDERRRRLIAARLSDGYSYEDLQLACLGCRASSFHMGDNDRGQRYCSIDLICRSAENVDRFMEIAETEAKRLGKKALEQASSTEPRGPMPESIREKITLMLGRYAKAKA